MSLFRPQGPSNLAGEAVAGHTNKLLGYPVTTSLSGRAIPIVYGTRQIAPNLICVANWVGNPIGSKLKGGGGKGGASQQYDYFATIILALCRGPILGVGQLWVNNIRYATSGGGSQVYAESYTVPFGGGTYTPVFANQIILDAGVYSENAFSVSINDFGSPGSTTLSGTQQVALTSVSGQSVISATVTNPGEGYFGPPIVTFVGGLGPGGVAATGHCVMSANPAGFGEGVLNIVIDTNGSGYVSAPTPVIVPFSFSGKPLGSGAIAYATLGSPGSVIGGGEYYFDSATGSYTFGPAMAGTTVQIGYIWNQAGPFNGVSPAGAIGFAVLTGDLGQPPWTFLTSQNPNLALGYSTVAVMGNANLELGSSGIIPNLRAEVFALGVFGGNVLDAPPLMPPQPVCVVGFSGGGVASIAVKYAPSYYSVAPAVLIVGNGINATATASINSAGLLTGISVTNAGSGYTSATVYVGNILQTAAGGIIVDLLTNPIWGPGGDMGFFGFEIGDTTDVATYTLANGIMFSLAVESQTSTVDVLRKLLRASNSTGFWSEGVLKFRSYGDTSAVGNGVLYSPQTQPIYDLDITNFHNRGKNSNPLTVARTPIADRKNRWTVEWTNRYNNYNKEPITEDDDCGVAISPTGLNPSPVESMDFICSQPVAQQVVNLLKQNGLYKNNTYSFKLGIEAILLEPMDLVTVTDPYMGLVTYPVRILSTDEDEKLAYNFSCEDFPWGTAAPTLHPKAVAANFGPGYYAAPGDIVAPIFWEALPQQIPGAASNTAKPSNGGLRGNFALMIALSGGTNWGGCDIYVSDDDVSYSNIGRQNGPSTLGVLTAPLPDGSDPDTTNTLSVDLTQSLGQLDSFTAAQENNFVSLILVDQELMSYETATLTSAYNYNLTNLRRGVYGTPIQYHKTGASFVFFDAGVFSYGYTVGQVGQLLYFKFTSFNTAGQREQSLSDSTIPAYSYRLTNPRSPYPWNAYLAQSLFVPNDPLENGSYFTLQQIYGLNADGTPLAQFQLTGLPPINVFTKLTTPPTIAFVSHATIGGTIPGGTNLVVAAASFGPDGLLTQLSEIVEYLVPTGTNTNAVTFSCSYAHDVATTISGSISSGSQTVIPSSIANIEVGMSLLIDDANPPVREIVRVVSVSGGSFTAVFANAHTGPFNVDGDSGVAFIASGSDAGGLVSNVGIAAGNGPFTILNLNDTGEPCPDSRFDHFQVQAKWEVHGGIWGGVISSVGTATLQFDGGAWTVNQLSGRIVSIVAKGDNSPIPIANVTILSNTADTFTISEDLTGTVVPGDVVFVRTIATSCTPTIITDTAWVNGGPGQLGTGLTPHVEKGNLYWVIAGTGAGQILPIADNSSTSITLSSPLSTLLDSTSIGIIVEPTWSTILSSQSTPTAKWSLFQILPTVDNGLGKSFVVQVLTVDANGDTSDQILSPFREVYMFGAGNVRTV